MKKYILVLLSLLIPFTLYAKSAPINSTTFGNGELAVLIFDNSITKVVHNNKTLNTLPHPTDKSKKILLFPISYYTTKSTTLNTYYGEKEYPLTVNIKPKEYKKEKLSVEPSKASPPKEVSERIKKEYNEAIKIYSTTTKELYWTTPFMLPMNSTITSEYGTARVFNNTLKSFHGGTDFRAAVGSSIYATNSGKVVLVDDRYLSGLSIIIDHGEGIYSTYFHLSKSEVKVGDMVKKGELIALSGKSGRVTGPHLHFGFVINGVNVDAHFAIDKINALF